MDFLAQGDYMIKLDNKACYVQIKVLFTNRSFPRFGDFKKIIPAKPRWEFFSITNCFLCDILFNNMVL